MQWPEAHEEHAFDALDALLGALAREHLEHFREVLRERGIGLVTYRDEAVASVVHGTVTDVLLKPRAEFSGTAPTPEELELLNHAAFARSVLVRALRCEVRCELP